MSAYIFISLSTLPLHRRHGAVEEHQDDIKAGECYEFSLHLSHSVIVPQGKFLSFSLRLISPFLILLSGVANFFLGRAWLLYAALVAQAK